jgi:hypothetical protein
LWKRAQNPARIPPVSVPKTYKNADVYDNIYSFPDILYFLKTTF